QLAGDPLACSLLGIVLAYVEVGPQQLEHGQQRDRLGVGLAGDLVDGDSLCAVALGELVAQPALADPGLAHDPDYLSLTAYGSLERRLEQPELLLAPHEARKASGAGDIEATPGGTHARQRMNMQWLA